MEKKWNANQNSRNLSKKIKWSVMICKRILIYRLIDTKNTKTNGLEEIMTEHV
jgi:hypothetical protein